MQSIGQLLQVLYESTQLLWSLGEVCLGSFTISVEWLDLHLVITLSIEQAWLPITTEPHLL